jgi:iron complex transport system substrate-binding protein
MNPTRGVVRVKRCTSCGESFECCAGGCWCDAVPLTDDVRTSLQERFDDCLCPTCLSRHAADRGVRIVSLVPSATEILFALGLGRSVVAVSHECDYPDEATQRPRITASEIATDRLSSRAIDEAVAQRMRDGSPLYRVDVEALRTLDPTLLITQGLCDVCALPAQAVDHAIRLLPRAPAIISLDANTVAGVLNSILTIGDATDTRAEAHAFVATLRARLARVTDAVASATPRRVLCLEWLDPPYQSGHWIPEMVTLAGGVDPASRPGIPSVATTWDELCATKPDVVVAFPCGRSVDRTVAEIETLRARGVWPSRLLDTPVVVLDSRYFTRPGPRIVEGVEMLASVLHPDRVTWVSPPAEQLVQWPAV